MRNTSPEDVVLLAHGSGGTLSHDLVAGQLLSRIGNPTLDRLDDSAVLEAKGRIAFTTDSYIVDPIFFPGGDIGRLAVCGTVNDLAVVGATPLCISLALIIEEGFPVAQLDSIMASVRSACGAKQTSCSSTLPVSGRFQRVSPSRGTTPVQGTGFC